MLIGHSNGSDSFVITSVAFRYLMGSFPNLTIVQSSASSLFLLIGTDWPNCACTRTSPWISWTMLPHHLEMPFAISVIIFAQRMTPRSLLEKLMRVAVVNPRSQIQPRRCDLQMAKRRLIYAPTSSTRSTITAEQSDGLAQRNLIAQPL
jgi:hypothetical protein